MDATVFRHFPLGRFEFPETFVRGRFQFPLGSLGPSQFFSLLGDHRVELFQTLAAALRGLGQHGELRAVAARLVAKRGRLPQQRDLFASNGFQRDAMFFQFAVDFGEPRFVGAHAAGLLRAIRLGLPHLIQRVAPAALQFGRLAAQRQHPLLQPSGFIPQVAAAGPLLIADRFQRRGPFADPAHPAFRFPRRGGGGRQLALRLQPPRLDPFHPRVPLAGLVADPLDQLIKLSELVRKLVPVGHSHLGAQFLQTLVVFPVSFGFRGLGADATQPVVNLFHDVLQPQEVLLDAFQPPLRLDFFRLEPADASRFFKHRPAVFRRSLQQAVDFPLFDQAIGVDADTRAAKQIFDVAKPAWLAIDQVFAFTAPVDAPRDVDFRRVDWQPAVRVVEHDSGFSGVRRLAATGSRTFEDDVGHVLATKALRALFAEDPLDRIDHIRFAGPIGADNHGDSRREFKAGFVRETLETG